MRVAAGDIVVSLATRLPVAHVAQDGFVSSPGPGLALVRVGPSLTDPDFVAGRLPLGAQGARLRSPPHTGRAGRVREGVPVAESRPLCWRRSFPGGPEQARAVRRFVGCLLAGCPYLDDVLLAADELVVNALRHTKSGQDGGSFVVEAARDGGRVAVSVADQGGPAEPVALDAAELAESGRGLRTVSLTAASWGWHGNDRGRTVTAVFSGSWAA